jgi:hypothetical protein
VVRDGAIIDPTSLLYVERRGMFEVARGAAAPVASAGESANVGSVRLA